MYTKTFEAKRETVVFKLYGIFLFIISRVCSIKRQEHRMRKLTPDCGSLNFTENT